MLPLKVIDISIVSDINASQEKVPAPATTPQAKKAGMFES
jgi:hypothetical protein